MGIFTELNEMLQVYLEDKFAIQEMANYKAKELNLPVNIWVDGPRELKHSRRIKAQNNYSTNFTPGDLISITISDKPKVTRTFKKINIENKDIDRLKQWIVLNKQALLDYADGKLSTRELDGILKPLS